ncbi:MAG: helix-turn-helix domain-containing protein [Candidatus Puniceispirillaceae bacterium]
MTPFGLKMRALRAKRRKTLQEQAAMLNVSSAYLSALESGKKGQPNLLMIDQICVWLGLIWDDAEELKKLAMLSHPKPTIQTQKLGAEATKLANQLAQNIDRLNEDDCLRLSETLELMLEKSAR